MLTLQSPPHRSTAPAPPTAPIFFLFLRRADAPVPCSGLGQIGQHRSKGPADHEAQPAAAGEGPENGAGMVVSEWLMVNWLVNGELVVSYWM